MPYLQQQLAEVNTGIDNLVNAIQMGIFNEATKKRMDELEASDIFSELALNGEPKLFREMENTLKPLDFQGVSVFFGTFQNSHFTTNIYRVFR